MTPAIQNITLILSFGTFLLDVAIIFVVLMLLFYGKNIQGKTKYFFQKIGSKSLCLGFTFSLFGFLLSLFYSEIANLPPCEFCWWQRVLLYPQVIVFAVAIYFKKKGIDVRQSVAISQTLSIIGVIVAGYQYFAQMFVPSLLSVCGAASVSCATLYFKSFGFITIPEMSLTLFVAITLVIYIRNRFSSE